MCRREEHVPFMNAAFITRAWKTAANAAKRPVKSGWKRGIPNFLTKSSMKMSDRGCRRCGKECREKTKNGTDRRTLHDREAFFYYRNICLIIFINGCFNLCNHLFLKSPDLPFCITSLPIFNEPGIPPIRMTFNPHLQVLSEKMRISPCPLRVLFKDYDYYPGHFRLEWYRRLWTLLYRIVI